MERLELGRSHGSGTGHKELQCSLLEFSFLIIVCRRDLLSAKRSLCMSGDIWGWQVVGQAF